MITVKEIANDKTSISSTRWAFATTIIFDMVMIAIATVVYSVFHFLGKPLDISFFYAIVARLGVLTTVTGTTKALQGFEPNKDKTNEDKVNKEEK